MTTGRSGRVAVVLLSTGIALAGCASAHGADHAPVEVAGVETPAGGGPMVVTLSEAAVERLGVRTATVSTAPDGRVVPYGALVYEADGSAWVFVQTEPLTYQRAPMTVAAIRGDQVTFTAGPPAGTEVVTVGAAELVGVEIGIDGEE